MAAARHLRLEEVTQALAELGGEANWEELLSRVTEKREGSYAPYLDQSNYEKTMFQHVQQHCEGYKKFIGPVRFKKVRRGRFRLVTPGPEVPPADAPITTPGHGSSEAVLSSPTPIAVDITEPPPRLRTEIYRILRDTELARKVKESHRFECQVCHNPPLKLSDIKLYAEAHHIKPLGSPHEGPDVPQNILCVCPSCHVLLDYGAIQLDVGQLSTSPTHTIGREYVDYHNQNIFRKVQLTG